MTAATNGEHKRINADEVHDLVTGTDAAAFYYPNNRVWAVHTASDSAATELVLCLVALGYVPNRDFSASGLTTWINAEDITS